MVTNGLELLHFVVERAHRAMTWGFNSVVGIYFDRNGRKMLKAGFFSQWKKSFSTFSSLYRWSLSHKRYLEVQAGVLRVTVGQGGSYQVNKKQVKTILCHSIPSTWVLTVEKNSVDNNDANNVFLFFFFSQQETAFRRPELLEHFNRVYLKKRNSII